jgi:hypothetical protein
MLVRLQAVEDSADLALRADHKRSPVYPHIFLAIHTFFFHHSIQIADGLVHIRQKRIGEIVFFFKLLLGRGFIGGDAEYNGSRFLYLFECVAEPARFNRSTGRVGFGIKEHDHVLAAIVLQRNCFSLFISKRELRGFIINFHGFSVFIKSMNLYSRKKFLASAALLLAAGLLTTAVAQRRKAHKLRATALVEVTTDAKGVSVTHVIPITVLDNGQFQDASTYKSSPRPMALEDGIVYEAQTSGIPVANATILSGANSNGWTALGRWQIVTAPVKKPDAPPSVSAPNDGRPILHRAAGSAPDSGSPSSSAPSPSATPAPGSSGTTSSGSTSSSPNDDRPVLRRPNESAPPAASGTPAPASTPSDQTNDRPTLHRPGDNAPSSAPSPAPTPSNPPASSTASPNTADNAPAASEDPDRPTLRRRGSVREEQTQPTPVENASTGTAPAPSAKKPMAAPGTTKTFVAVSDTQSADIRSFDFKWKTGEEEPMELKMRKLALAQIPKQTVQPTKESAQLTPKSLKNVVIRSFDLDLSNDAVIVLSAEVPATVPSTKQSDAKFISRYVTVVARVDFEGEPQKVLASVTDSSRLDVTPRLELIDAVDVDGDGVAELLFREYGYDEKGFVIYGVGRSTATKFFEGASRPLTPKN